MTALATVPATDPAAILATLDRDGGVIVSDYLDTATLTTTRAAIEQALTEVPWCNTFGAYEDEFFGLTTKRLHGVLNYGPAIEQCLTHPLAREVGEQVLGQRAAMSTGEIMAIGPEESQQRLHWDGVSWERAALSQEFLFSVNIAITDFTADNGATVVAPGSHRWEAGRTPTEAELTSAIMPAGSALFYTGRLIHSGGANRTDDTRIGLYFGYIPIWLRPLENSVQTHRPEVLQGIGERARELLGLSDEGFVAYLE